MYYKKFVIYNLAHHNWTAEIDLRFPKMPSHSQLFIFSCLFYYSESVTTTAMVNTFQISEPP